MTTDFAEYAPPTPNEATVAGAYAEFHQQLDSGVPTEKVVAEWDQLQRQLETWASVANIRFTQDTSNPAYQAERELADKLRPKFLELSNGLKARLLQAPHREPVAQHFGEHALALWQCDVDAFDPSISEDLVEESGLSAKYTELIASATFEFEGETLNLAGLRKHLESPDRGIREEADGLYWGWFHDQTEAIDDLFGKLVAVRDRIAKKQNQESFTSIAYHWMHRTDYGPSEVATFRDQIREHITPLSVKLRQQQADRLGVDRLMSWDQSILFPEGNPKPQGDEAWLLKQATAMFTRLGGGMDTFFKEMGQRNLMDLDTRDNKAGGGYCDVLPEFDMPFIFANFTGSKHDVGVFTHEMGHAYQVYKSLNQPLVDFLFPTCEACEIHSMGLEFLTWPEMDLFFDKPGEPAGQGGERFRQTHLIESLTIMPYIASIDHFQHLVYASPSASADDRAEMWREVEAIYRPDLTWEERPHPASGRTWQAKQHVFNAPFYYIDYALAQTCALQLWMQAEENREETLERYYALCRRGGEVSFRNLIADAGIQSPFEAGCLADVVAKAKAQLS